MKELKKLKLDTFMQKKFKRDFFPKGIQNTIFSEYDFVVIKTILKGDLNFLDEWAFFFKIVFEE